MIREWLPRCKTHLIALAAVVVVCLLLFLGVKEVTSHLRLVYPIQGGRDGIGELVATSRVCQTFVSQYNNLNRVDVMMSNYGRQNSGSFVFYLRADTNHLSDPKDEQAIVTLTPDASIVKSTDYISFDFAPIPDSAGRSYAFCLEAPQAELSNAITAVGILGDTYPDGEAIFREMWGQGIGVSDLDFRLGYAFSPWDRLFVFADLLARYKPLLCGDWRFYALIGIAYLTLLYALFLKIVRNVTSTQE